MPTGRIAFEHAAQRHGGARGAASLVAALAPGCLASTEIVVDVTTDVRCERVSGSSLVVADAAPGSLGRGAACSANVQC
jgi:hypothetical protein